MEKTVNVIETIDENGNSIKFELFNMISFEGKDYALLLPVDKEQSEELVLMEILKDGEDYSFASIEDDEEFERVSDYIESLEDEE
ncbi:DUF1292 domain-containing protein [bacterium]|nr:DUF1292 domain-containing protein [bacterium]